LSLPFTWLEESIMFTHLRPAVFTLLLLTVLTGLAYPLAVTGLGQLLFTQAANGSLVAGPSGVAGSRLIGQTWTQDKYFQGRPSAAGQGYDATASSGSNLGPTSAKLRDQVAANIAALKAAGATGLLPADAVTASASGLDPHVSPAFALLQVPRVAKARGLPEAQVQALVAAHIEQPTLGFLGEPRLNVLLLNLALDGVSSPSNG
jgi:K+-transporting ATPase ATPase C chain